MDEGTTRRYWAFISYSHADRKWGEWLHRALETYRVPKRLVGLPHPDGGTVPRRLLPVFRDREELPSSANLGDNIDLALQGSRRLVVICSPRAAASRWVNEEVARFQALPGGVDRVLCLIVDGEPNASDKPESGVPECFPPALRSGGREPIAADVRPGGDGRGNARLKLLAGVLGVPYDELRQRERQRRRARLLAWTAASLLLLAAMAGGALWWWVAYRRDSVRYYAGIESVYGVLEGQEELPASEVAHRDGTFRIARRGSRGPVRLMEIISPTGQLTRVFDQSSSAETFLPHMVPGKINPDLPARIVYEYNEHGQVSRVTATDPEGHSIYELQYLSPQVALYLTGQDDTDKSLDSRSRKGASRLVIDYETSGPATGEVRRIRYTDGSGQPQPDNEGVYGHDYRHDGQGLIVEDVSVGADGRPTVVCGTQEYFGVYTTRRYEYDSLHRISLMTSSDDSGAAPDPATVLDSPWRIIYDEHGNTLEYRHQPADPSKPGQMACTFHFFHGRIWRLDATGFNPPDRTIQYTGFFDGDEHRLIDGSFTGCATNFDKDGTRTAVAVVDERETPVNGVSRVWISEVVPDSSAARLGLQPGDIILRFGDQTTTETSLFIAWVKASRTPTPLLLLRNGEVLTVTVPPGKLGAAIEDTLRSATVPPPTTAPTPPPPPTLPPPLPPAGP